MLDIGFEFLKIWHKRREALPLFFYAYNGLPVCAMCERVNRYTVNFDNMLTLPVTYGKMFLDRKGCGRRWIEALKEMGYGWRLRVVCDWQQK